MTVGATRRRAVLPRALRADQRRSCLFGRRPGSRRRAGTRLTGVAHVPQPDTPGGSSPRTRISGRPRRLRVRAGTPGAPRRRPHVAAGATGRAGGSERRRQDDARQADRRVSTGPARARSASVASRSQDSTPVGCEHVALVTQEVHVFAGALADDLRLVAPDATDARAARRADRGRRRRLGRRYPTGWTPRSARAATR